MSLCTDSRKVKSGDTFFCIKGTVTDGHKFVSAAVKNGAQIIVHEDPIERPDVEGVVYIKVPDTVAALNDACDSYYCHASKKLTVFGITGTNGKTTTANIISQVFTKKELCGYIGTINTKLGSRTFPPSLTTPDPITLHSIFHKMYEDNAKAVVLEVSAHGLSQRRTASIDFDCAIFTNLTQDHLDYYHTMENYFSAKKILFSELKPDGIAVLNADIPCYDELRACCKCKVVTYGISSEATYRARNIEYTQDSVSFDLEYDDKTYRLTTDITGEYNVYNILAATAAMNQEGMPLEDIINEIKHIDQIPGRQQRINEGQDFDVIIDYAHTPDGYEQLLSSIKKGIKGGRLITVCGAPGGRDHSKRHLLGFIAENYSDYVIITSYDPRQEQAEDIVNQIYEGTAGSKSIEKIPNRIEAISKAISIANTKDTVIILGKGVEDFMHTADGKVPYDGDDNIASKEIKKRLSKEH